MNFKLFFENSNSNVFYHGSFRIFNNFSSRFPESNDFGYYGFGFYFTPNEKTARSYGPNLYKCQLNLDNPFVWNGSPESLWEKFDVIDGNDSPKNSKQFSKLLTQKLQQEGYNSIIVKSMDNSKILEICVFDNKDVKILSKQISSDLIDDDMYS